MHYHRDHSDYRKAANAFSKRFLRRWDVAWVSMPQMLTSIHQKNSVKSKTRPFVVMADAAFDVDGNGHLKNPVTLLGIGCTSKEHLIEDRPHIGFTMPGQGIESYAFADNLSNVTCPAGSKLQFSMRLPQYLAQELRAGLDHVVKPESGFYLRRRFKGHVPGQVWRIETHVLTGQGIVLLRRGPYVVEHDGHEKIHYAPYMVAILRDNANAMASVDSMLGVGWNQVDVGVVHESALIRQVGADVGKETVGIMLATLRQRIGSPRLDYNEPIYSNAWFMGPALAGQILKRGLGR